MDESQYQYMFHNTSMPPHMIDANNLFPCCATFFVDSDLVRTRSKDEYLLIISRLRQWSKEHPRVRNQEPAVYCGRVMEYTWHILLTNRTNIPQLPSNHSRIWRWISSEGPDSSFWSIFHCFTFDSSNTLQIVSEMWVHKTISSNQVVTNLSILDCLLRLFKVRHHAKHIILFPHLGFWLRLVKCDRCITMV
jgi:hypothetical protein